MAKNVPPDGHLVISVPAWPMMFSDHDRELRHFRRYRPKRLKKVIANSGLGLHGGGGLFHSLLIARAIGVLFERAFRGRSSASRKHWPFWAVVRRALEAALAADTGITRLSTSRRVEFPGLSYSALFRPLS